MLVIGLTGSIAMGKSEAARILAAEGFPVFDADSEVHQFYDTPEGTQLINKLAPSAVVSGRVNRKILGDLILQDKTLLETTERHVHAEIAKRCSTFIEHHRTEGCKAVVLDIPLLLEKGAVQHVDKVLVVSATPELQRSRAMARGMTEKRLVLIMAWQLPDKEKQMKADAVVFNNSTLSELKSQLLSTIHQWGLK